MSMCTVMPSTTDIIVEDTDPRLSYSSSQWKTIQSHDDIVYSGGTQHLSYLKDAQFTFSFEGTYVWYRSDTNFDHGAFEVTVDGERFPIGTSVSDPLQNAVMLWCRELKPGQHTMSIRNIEDNKAFTLDNLYYRPGNGMIPLSPANPSGSSTPNPTPSPHGSLAQSGGSKQASKPLPAGVYVGIALGSIAQILLVLLCFLICRDRRRKKYAQDQEKRRWQRVPSPPLVQHRAPVPIGFAPSSRSGV